MVAPTGGGVPPPASAGRLPVLEDAQATIAFTAHEDDGGLNFR
jgi:hypothetical protein